MVESIAIEMTEARSNERSRQKFQISTVPPTHATHSIETEAEQVLYKVEDVPSLGLSIVLGLQHYLTMFSGAVGVPYLITPKLCMKDGDAGQSLIISTTFFVAGIATLLQSFIGNRLPIIQGPSLAFLIPTLAILGQPHYVCPSQETVANYTKEERDEVWMSRMREVQGAIIVASLVEVIVGFTGLMGFLMRWITPLSIAPTITLIGLNLFGEAANQASGHWGIAALTVILLLVFSQYMINVNVPMCTLSKEKKCQMTWFPFFKIFPVMLTIVISWGFCAILTETNVLAPDNNARTDTRMKVLHETQWIWLPYPGQWGWPVVSIGSVLGVVAGVISSSVESVGDYYACARLAGAPPPPVHAINRGIWMEGVGCVMAGCFGTGSGLTSFSQNIGAIGITKVGSRRVIQFTAVICILFGLVSKFGAIFIAIPPPVMGGIFCVTFSLVTGVGLSNLQFVNLNCSRNLFVLGFSVFMGLCVPKWLEAHPNSINTGNLVGDQIIEILLKTSMFVAGFLGCLLDNTIPGSEDDRGITRWRAETMAVEIDDENVSKCYDLPCGMNIIRKLKFLEYLPVSPTYDKFKIEKFCSKRSRKEQTSVRSELDEKFTQL